LGLCIQAYTNLFEYDRSNSQFYNDKINFLIDELEKLIPSGFSGACWGYDFYWQARNADIPAYQPTIVATGIITNALFEYYKTSGNSKAKALFLSSADFVIKDLNRTVSENGLCFSYSPFDNQIVFNANMKAVRLLAQIYSLSSSEQYKTLANDAVKFVMKFQRDDGAWVYSNKLNTRIDNYHTGYVLSCLKTFMALTENNDYEDQIKIGFDFYKSNFIDSDNAPKFFHNYKYPIDCTAASQLIITLLDFDEKELAQKVANYMVENMFDEEGYFYFRQFKNYLIKTPYMRWSQAWMFAALSYLLRSKNS